MDSSQEDQQNTLNFAEVAKAAKIIRAVKHPLRQRILNVLNEHEDISVTALYRELGIVQAVASQSLGIMRKEKIVVAKRDRHLMRYSINPGQIKAISAFTKNIILTDNLTSC